jgi:DNA-directed DNA polymerase III PolC
MPEKFAHLHAHSYYSFLEGLASPAELVQAAVRFEMPALALTDRVGLSGAVEFYLACKDAGIKPVLGLHLPIDPPPDLVQAPGEVVLLAMDREGWASLCRLSSALLVDRAGDPLPRIPWEILGKEAAGLLCLAGFPESPGKLTSGEGEREAASYLARLAEVFPGRLYVALRSTEAGDRRLVEILASAGEKLKLPVAALHSIYYLEAGQERLQRLATAVRLNKRLAAVADQEAAPPGSFFVSPAEMAARFADHPEAIEATREIADRCSLELPIGVPVFPEIPLPPGQDAMQVLRQKAEAGARQRYGEVNEQIRERLESELQVIEARGYAPLFLIMEEILDYARQRGVPVSSRGSAASSLVAYCLGITNPDPLRLNLYFERFLNPARASPPDIDTDLCSRRRDEVIQFVYKRYGADRVAMVSTINRFRRRSALRETAKAHGFLASEISRLVDELPWGWRRHSAEPGISPFAELSGRYRAARYQAVFSDAAKLIGSPRHLSVHAGGVVIAPARLTDLVPIQLAAKGIVITQLDLESVSHLGLVKIDLLGIRGLTVLGDVAAAICSRNPAANREPLGPLKAIEDKDLQTAELVRAGRTIGCFQIESPGMQATLKEIQARSIDDVMVALALYRPGPLTGGLKDAFVRRHRGVESVAHLHPSLSTLLDDTHGVILYQEQVLRIAHELAGLSLADADLLRRAMSHFDPGEQMRTLKERFITGARMRHHVPEETAERIWEMMAAFAGYGFPKAHAASYALIAWQSAWCKAHEPGIFMAAVLANWGGYYGQQIYLNEARRLGLPLRPPHVNYARREFSVQDLAGKQTLFMGLDQVRGLTRRTQGRILSERPFRSLEDFLARADPRPAEAENLIRCGALAGFGSIPRLLRRMAGGRQSSTGQLPLFPVEAAAAPEDSDLEEDWTLQEKVAAQEAILGVGVDAHRLELAADQIASAGAITTVEAAGRLGAQVRIAGTRFAGRRGRDERGGLVYVLSLEDLVGMLDVILPAQVYHRDRQALVGRQPLIVEGTVKLDAEGGEPIIEAQRVRQIA